jgi:hypothetical protein
LHTLHIFLPPHLSHPNPSIDPSSFFFSRIFYHPTSLLLNQDLFP